MKNKLARAALMTLSAMTGTQVAQAATNLYVAPTNLGAHDCLSPATACTLTAARDRVRLLNANMTSDIIVNLAAGRYPLTSTFQLGPQDSGTNNYSVIYQGPTNASTPAVLSGGIAVTGWIQNDWIKHIWRAPLATAGVAMRQLYVNGTRAVRARTPNVTNLETGEGYLNALSTVNAANALNFVAKTSDVPTSFNKIGDVEVVWIHHWKHLRARLNSTTVAGTSTTLNFKSPENTNGVYTQFPQATAPYYFENDFKLLDQGGEWYFNPTPVYPPTTAPQVYYIPRASENANPNNSEVIAPQLETLVDVSGTSTANVHHVQFKNISFMHSNWNVPNTVGYGVYQAATFTEGNGHVAVPAAFNIKNADTVVLENNVFTRTGAHAVLLTGTVSNYRVVRNQFSDLSAGAVYDQADASTNGLISNNLIEKYGRAYADAAGILVMHPKNLTVSNNEVRSGGYSGISLGWRWNDVDYGFDNNQILNNRIHNVMQVLDDGAGIYTLGRMMNTVFQGNFVYDVKVTNMYGGFPTVGIYLDQGASGRTVQGNVVTNVSQSFKVNDYNSDTHQNVFTGNYYDNIDFGVTNTADHVVTGNTYVAPNAPWTAPMLTITNNSGVH